MSDILFKAAAAYAADHGWPIVRNYGMRSNGSCMCHRGFSCPTPGKHPVEDDWLPGATKDEEKIAAWFDSGTSWNIGLPLGPASGLVDLEWDDEKSLATAQKFGLPSLATPAYKSSRGGHRLVVLDERLITLDSAMKKIGGLEVRFGGGGKQCQSIIPPSRHHTGASYQWEPGRSPSEVEPARMPEALVLAVIAACSGDARGGGLITKNTVYQKKVGEGERHLSMVSWVSSEVMRMRDVHDEQEQQHLLLIMRSLNQTQLTPPLKEPELQKIWGDQLRWGMKARAAGVMDVKSTDPEADEKVEDARSSHVYCTSGLENRDGEFFPGMWKLTVVHGDPREFRLHVPIVASSDGEQDYVDVSLSSGEWSSAAAVARKILEATGTIDMTDPNPKEWSKTWVGYSERTPGSREWVRVRGLKVKLMDERKEEWPPAEQKRFAVVAGWLLDELSNAVLPDGGEGYEGEASEPHPSGRPSWVVRGDEEPLLYFSWNRVWEDIVKTRKVKLQDGDQVSLKRRLLASLGDKEFTAERRRTSTGVRRRFLVWTKRHLAHLGDIAHPAENDGPSDQKPLILRAEEKISEIDRGVGSLVCGPT